jgi:hypothetical protein
MKQIDLTKNNRKSPFKVPEGYFDDLTANIMAQIPEEPAAVGPTEHTVPEPKVTLFMRIKPYLYLAAMIGGLAFGVKVYKYQQQYYAQKHPAVATITTEQADKYVDEVCDFAMIDDHDVFACATDNY